MRNSLNQSNASDEQKIVRAEDAYSVSDRFRLWRSVWREAERLGAGYRALHAHILSTLYALMKSGRRIEDWNGNLINPDALRPDDLYGFMGKTKPEPTGPGRKLNDRKIAVLDVYFKEKKSSDQNTSSSGDAASELRTALYSFFEKQTNTPWASSRQESRAGIYLPTQFSSGTILTIQPQYGLSSNRLPMILVSDEVGTEHFKIHRITLPLRLRHFGNSGWALEHLKLEPGDQGNSRVATSVYGGVASRVRNAEFKDVETFASVLRHRSLYTPLLGIVELLRLPGNPRVANSGRYNLSENFDTRGPLSYGRCADTEGFERTLYEMGFSEQLFFELSDFIDRLDGEV